jgi:DNA adenine methylase
MLYTFFDNDGISTVTKEDFYNYRKIIMTQPPGLTKAVYYFIINRCSFSGATLSGGFSEEASKKRFTKSSVKRVAALNLTNFQLTNEDFKNVVDDTTGVIFLDPPYYLEKNSKLYGKSGDHHKDFDHAKLYEILKNKKNWFMTYNNCPFIRELYKDFTILEENWTYGMNKSKKSSEIIILWDQSKVN